LKPIGLRSLVWAGILLALFAVGCATVEPASPSVLRVGVTPDFPPLVFKEKGRIQGLEADLAQMLADALGRELRFVEVPWKDQINALEDGRTDIIMSSMSITPMRAQRVLFVEPYLKVGQMALVRRQDADKFANPLLLVNTAARVGVGPGTTGELLLEGTFKRAERVPIAKSQDAPQALLRKRIDVYLADAPTIWWLAARYEGEGLQGLFEPLTNEVLAWAVARDSRALLEVVNRLLATWKADGTLDQVMSNWIP
jgi:polar amino acid transport system substrate-binding protein